ncbi:uncharacterized protein MELLADRAFT_56122 [Melampsora larici-populina 98AG31]|uniref:Uncharacterized protein n=1 Tax=Melampsora larici-populina (strain 98AG31 / pathotype 3-4-7) TaxID=747676 RepID=F4RM44_MELLP|nr:uncharacterized protein MELLADRAFT_56122 [Melampsora larici-populina 98AG31]EGG06535.1 hypothetical protein MELLADRAFT_56122 [Melampsora larici-populina 98AG31]
MVPLDGINESQIQKSIKKISTLKEMYPNLIKYERIKYQIDEDVNDRLKEKTETDVIRLIKIKSYHEEENRIRKCSKCGRRSIENLRFFKKSLIDDQEDEDPDQKQRLSRFNRLDRVYKTFDQRLVCDFGLDFLLSLIEFHKVCICDGFWITDF